MLEISRLPGLNSNDQQAFLGPSVSPTPFAVRAHLAEPPEAQSLSGWILRLQILQLFHCRDYFCSWVGLNSRSVVTGRSAVRQFFAQLPSPAC